MSRWLRWLGNVASTASGGPAFVDPSDLDLTLTPADDSAARWVARPAILTPFVVVILIVVGVPWPVVAVVAAILLMPLLVNRIRVLLHR